MKNVLSFEVINHGVENSQYFQGCGIAYTSFEDVATGIGGSPFEALEDALESLAQNDWDVSGIKNELSKESEIPVNEENEENESMDVFHYVSVRVSTQPE